MTKRKGNGAAADGNSRSAKRSKNSDLSLKHQSSSSQLSKSATSFTEQPRQDPTYGQRGAFPGLDHIHVSTGKLGSGNAEQDELDLAAMAYLREVR